MATSFEDRLTRLEDAILALADARDPAARQFPVVGSGDRSRVLNDAEERLWRVAQEIKADRHSSGLGPA